MEAYKQKLLLHFGNNCASEDDIYYYIKDNPKYTYHLNEEGELHSNYTGSCYEPAITYTRYDLKIMFWLFNGKIKDCIHPFMVLVLYRIQEIEYYSSQRIESNQPITDTVYFRMYNRHMNTTILDNPHYKTCKELKTRACDFNTSLFTSEFYPFCEEMDDPLFRFKFAD